MIGTTAGPSLPRHGPLTAAGFFVVERGVGACEIVYQLVLPNEQRALRGDDVKDGG